MSMGGIRITIVECVDQMILVRVCLVKVLVATDRGRLNPPIHRFGTDSSTKMAIFAVENGDITVFKTVEVAEKYIEPIDVKNNEYKIYDSRGFVYSASVVKKSNLEYVKIKKKKEKDLKSLGRAVIDFLAYTEPSKNWKYKNHIYAIQYRIKNMKG